jgi:hypothetical protein
VGGGGLVVDPRSQFESHRSIGENRRCGHRKASLLEATRVGFWFDAHSDK